MRTVAKRLPLCAIVLYSSVYPVCFSDIRTKLKHGLLSENCSFNTCWIYFKCVTLKIKDTINIILNLNQNCQIKCLMLTRVYDPLRQSELSIASLSTRSPEQSFLTTPCKKGCKLHTKKKKI